MGEQRHRCSRIKVLLGGTRSLQLGWNIQMISSGRKKKAINEIECMSFTLRNLQSSNVHMWKQSHKGSVPEKVCCENWVDEKHKGKEVTKQQMGLGRTGVWIWVLKALSWVGGMSYLWTSWQPESNFLGCFKIHECTVVLWPKKFQKAGRCLGVPLQWSCPMD